MFNNSCVLKSIGIHLTRYLNRSFSCFYCKILLHYNQRSPRNCYKISDKTASSPPRKKWSGTVDDQIKEKTYKYNNSSWSRRCRNFTVVYTSHREGCRKLTLLYTLSVYYHEGFKYCQTNVFNMCA
jgi:hypothetical protein